MSFAPRGGGGMSSPRRIAALRRLALAILALASLSSPAAAQGFFEQLFGGGGYPQDPYPSHYGAGRSWSRHGARAPSPAWRAAATQGGAPRRQESERAPLADAASSARSYCVRECDGYFFPIGLYNGAADAASHARACERLCPGAHASLYVMRAGSDKIEDAVAARGGGTYARLLASIQRREEGEKEASCACRAAEAPQEAASALYLDPTLRRGDAVMTAHGVEVFHGGARFPYTRRDFQPLAQSRDVAADARRRLAAMEKASRPGLAAMERRVERRAARPLAERRSQSSGRPPGQ